jgi:hypothetical protein
VQVIADGDRSIGALDAHMDVEAPGVVPLRDPAELLAQAVVMLGVDDALVEVVGPRVRAHRGQPHAHALGEPEQADTMLVLHRDGIREGLAPA